MPASAPTVRPSCSKKITERSRRTCGNTHRQATPVPRVRHLHSGGHDGNQRPGFLADVLHRRVALRRYPGGHAVVGDRSKETGPDLVATGRQASSAYSADAKALFGWRKFRFRSARHRRRGSCLRIGYDFPSPASPCGGRHSGNRTGNGKDRGMVAVRVRPRRVDRASPVFLERGLSTPPRQTRSTHQRKMTGDRTPLPEFP